MRTQKQSPRADYRRQEFQRVKDSPSLADTFDGLKALTVDMAFFDQEGNPKSGKVKYTVNLEHSKSVFRFDCPNGECVGGDFDLSAELARAVASRQTSGQGEATCPGWRNKATMGQVSCHNVLRYKFTLAYA